MEFRPHRIKSTPTIRSVLASKTKPEGGYRKPVERLFNISEKFKAGAGMRHGSGLLTTSEILKLDAIPQDPRKYC